MRYFPGVVLCLIAAGIFVYNMQSPGSAINIPMLADWADVSTRAERGALTWKLFAGFGGVALLLALALQMAKPGEEKPIREKDLPR